MIVDPQVRKFCGPLFFTSSTETPKNNIKSSGSFGLVRVGNMNLLVTCWHVLEGFKELHSRNPDLRFGIGIGGKRPVSLSFEELMEKVVDNERRCDLATIDVSDALDLVAASDLEFYDLSSNRPPKVKVGDVLYLIGFPGQGRIENDKSIGFPRQPIGVQATDVGEYSFISRPTSLHLDEAEFGGISGAPCYIVKEDAPIRLVGFATGLAPNQMKMLQFTYAKYIGKDGIIRYMP